MKKLFSLFLAFSLLFLTACNTSPPTETTTSDTTEQKNPSDSMTDQIIHRPIRDLLDLPSRIIFNANLRQEQFTYYYSKVDEKAYVYCFDPLCDHSDHTCLATPSQEYLFGMMFAQNRFYRVTGFGQIFSFAFDGSDKKIEYDAKYDLEDMNTNIWSSAELYGQYIYICLGEGEQGNPHTLRFNIETKEMEDLTEKTGNYIIPSYFYNNMIYGQGDYYKTGQTYFKADIDLKSMEVEDHPVYIDHAVGSMAIGQAFGEELNRFGIPDIIGMDIYDFKTDERRFISNETIGTNDWAIVSVTEEYIYFYDSKIVEIGTVNGPGGRKVTVQKYNNGKLYRMNLDGTNIVCVYDNPDYELNRNTVIYGDRVVMKGRYVTIENGEKKVWGGPLQVAVINEDGTFGEFREVEFVG